MWHAITFEDLLDYVEGRLGPAETRRVVEHLQSGCSRCREDLAWLRRTVGLMAADELRSAPPAAIRRAQALYRPPRRAPAPTAGPWAPFHGVRGLRSVAVIALVSLLILAGSWWAWGSTSVAQAAMLAEVNGAVEVRLAGSSSWQPGTAGMVLAEGSAVRSGPGATAVLQYADGSQTYLDENAQVELLELNGRRDGRASRVRLVQSGGRTRHRLAKGHDSIVEVEAPGGVVGASSGDYEVDVEEEAIAVHAGRGGAALEVHGRKTRLSPGEKGWVKGGKLVVTTPTPGHGSDPGPAGKSGDGPRSGAPRSGDAPRAGSTGKGQTQGDEAAPTQSRGTKDKAGERLEREGGRGDEGSQLKDRSSASRGHRPVIRRPRRIKSKLAIRPRQ